jgi:hypothetical protein
MTPGARAGLLCVGLGACCTHDVAADDGQKFTAGVSEL